MIAHKYVEILETQLKELYDIKNYTIIEEAKTPQVASNINHMKDLMIAAIIGIILVGGYIIILYVSKNTILGAEEIEEKTKIKVFGKIKKEKRNDKVIDYFVHGSRNIATLNRIAISAQMNKGSKPAKTKLITGASSDVGTTFITTNLATSYAKLGHKVLIIDANFKNGLQSKIFNVSPSKGLGNAIMDLQHSSIENLNITEYIARTPIEGIQVMNYGQVQLVEKNLISENTLKLLKKLETQFDVILMDCGPISKDVTPLILSIFVGTVLLVVQYDKTKMEEIEDVKENLRNINEKIDGIILNQIEE